MSTASGTSRWGVVGHDEAIEQLQRSIDNSSVAHAYLLTGATGIGRTTLALAFAKALVCEGAGPVRPCGECRSCKLIDPFARKINHPDVLLADLEWQAAMFDSNSDRTRVEFSIEAVRYLRQHILGRPVASDWKIQIVDDADRLSHVAPDAFLKTLEEPPPYAVIILIASAPEAVLETIRSRCRPIALGLASRSEIEAALIDRGFEPDEAARRAALARGRMARALADEQEDRELLLDVAEMIADNAKRLRLIGPIAQNHSRNREQTAAVLSAALALWRDGLRLKVGLDPEIAIDPDVRSLINRRVEALHEREIHQAIWATQRAMEDLGRSVQARIAMAAMISEWP